jgi:hypothetical protein
MEFEGKHPRKPDFGHFRGKLDPPEPLIKGANIHKVIIRPSVGIAFEIDFLRFIDDIGATQS